MKKNHGFTIIELLITVAVAGTMLAIGIPAFSDWTKMNRMVSQTNSIISALQLARSEAVTRGQSTRIEPLSAGTDWSGGWQLVQDSDGSVIRVYDAMNDSALTSGAGTLIFKDDGSLDALNPVTLTLRATTCPNGDDYQRFIRVPISGVPFLHSDYDCASTTPWP